MELQGIEHQNNESAIAPIGGSLPYSLEIRTSQLLDVLLAVFPTDKSRSQINDWLSRNTKSIVDVRFE
jgi:hypothetical protein